MPDTIKLGNEMLGVMKLGYFDFSVQGENGLDVVVEDSSVQMDNVYVVAAGSSMQVQTRYTGKYLPAWLHAREEKQSINDPITDDKEFKAWDKDVLASHIISLYICMQPSGESEVSSLQIASTDQEHIKTDLRQYNCT
eukprot:g20568.t1